MERHNDLSRMATKKLAKILDIDELEAAHKVAYLVQALIYSAVLMLKHIKGQY
jgi:hypothetical protein